MHDVDTNGLKSILLLNVKLILINNFYKFVVLLITKKYLNYIKIKLI